MQIAIVSATDFEQNLFDINALQKQHSVKFYTHGIGLMLSTFLLCEIVKSKPDLIIQCGLAGTYHNHLKIGETVIVENEILGDTGAQDHLEQLDLFDMQLMNANEFPFSNSMLKNEYVTHLNTSLKKVSGLTVNLSSGNASTIQLRKEKYNADIETMEGAALHYVCLQKEIPFIQFRAISNLVEPRNKDNWKMKEAIESYTEAITAFIHQIPSNL
jgi:futalosine hydrolase